MSNQAHVETRGQTRQADRFEPWEGDTDLGDVGDHMPVDQDASREEDILWYCLNNMEHKELMRLHGKELSGQVRLLYRNLVQLKHLKDLDAQWRPLFKFEDVLNPFF